MDLPGGCRLNGPGVPRAGAGGALCVGGDAPGSARGVDGLPDRGRGWARRGAKGGGVGGKGVGGRSRGRARRRTRRDEGVKGK